MSGTHNRHDNQLPFEDWDSVFDDAEPTRVLSPSPEQGRDNLGEDTVILGARSQPESTLSATRYGQNPYPAESQQTHPATAQLPLSQQVPEVALGNIAPRPSSPGVTFRRVQFLPASSGALVAYALSTGLFALMSSLWSALGIATYDSFTGAALAVSSSSTQGQALPWVMVSAFVWLVSFGWAGYTAGRMAALAPTKQALGVIAVCLLAVLIATLATWATASLPDPLTPSFALQPLLAPDLAIGFLTLLAAALVAAIGSLLGSGLGVRYYRALTRHNS